MISCLDLLSANYDGLAAAAAPYAAEFHMLKHLHTTLTVASFDERVRFLVIIPVNRKRYKWPKCIVKGRIESVGKSGLLYYTMFLGPHSPLQTGPQSVQPSKGAQTCALPLFATMILTLTP